MIRDILAAMGILTLLVANIVINARSFIMTSLLVCILCMLVPQNGHLVRDGEVMAGRTRLSNANDVCEKIVAKPNPYRPEAIDAITQPPDVVGPPPEIPSFSLPKDVDEAVVERWMHRCKNSYMSATNKRRILDAMHRDYQLENSGDSDCFETTCKPLTDSRVSKAHYF